jgi:glutamate racemase
MGLTIGILDSGLGGLTVARKLDTLLPGADILYFGDTACFPYGGRSTGIIEGQVERGIDYLKEEGADLIVLACVTGSAAWLARGGRNAGVPVVDAVTATVERVMALKTCRRIGVVGTSVTVQTGVFDRLIRAQDPAARVYSCALPLLVPLIEEGRLDSPETRMIVKKYLHPLKVRQIDTLVMGCNYFVMVKPLMQRKIGKRNKLVDCVDATADSTLEYVKAHMPRAVQAREGGSRLYCLTDLTERMAAVGKEMFGRNLTLRLSKL